jgi:hypothetical protein
LKPSSFEDEHVNHESISFAAACLHAGADQDVGPKRGVTSEEDFLPQTQSTIECDQSVAGTMPDG